ncbi:N-terminal protein methyltransferase [Saccharomycopsis crataegensis]|uniref:Alpha N-terminal protein methyltransferase 1 n=1 Tax=Saccharomycopsis crataegensis TaxID=43959 RepID=A0AAV5QM05_9ASCO|nr:N-terminal protein methyltransferase [Saccharomycopsis crataegensis]
MPAKLEITDQPALGNDIDEEVPVDKFIDYSDGLNYWRSIPATVDGVLGGFGEDTVVPKRDISGSITFLRKLSSRMRPAKGEIKYGFELGAGIGRVSKNLLSKYCDKVDLLEYNEHFVAQMDEELAELKAQGKLGEIFNMGMQDYHQTWKNDRKYWLVWCQWCLGYLNDDLLVEFLKFMKSTLSENGTIIVKENTCINISDDDIFDDEDSSVTRTDSKFKEIFARSGLKLIAQDVQKGLPKELYPVKMYALKPDPSFVE